MRKQRNGRRILIWGIMICMVCFGGRDVQAEGESAQYTYDSLGRVETVTYPGKGMITYVYDKNGNITEVKKQTTDVKTTESKEKENTTEKITNLVKEENVNSVKPKTGMSSISRPIEYYKIYNKFKKRKPVVKSVKTVKKKGKLYLKIQIRQLEKVYGYKEIGYQIRYATNEKFKNAESITVNRNQKKKLTSKTWKVKKKKTYYVKVRAYMKTNKGKKIYTKYSKVKKVSLQ